MDINQQLEFLNMSADVLTENDVVDKIIPDTSKIVSSKGIYDATTAISAAIDEESAKISVLENDVAILKGSFHDISDVIDAVHENTSDIEALVKKVSTNSSSISKS